MSLSVDSVGSGDWVEVAREEALDEWDRLDEEDLTKSVPSGLAVVNGAHRYSAKPTVGSAGILEKASSAFNNQTILRGAAKKWDETRIRNGKLAEFKQIGAQEVVLQTPSGGSVHASYFSAENFLGSLKRLGGQPSLVRVCRDLPLLQLTRPATIRYDDQESPAVLIPYDPAHAALFKDVSGLQRFCATQSLLLLQKDLTPLPPPRSGLMSYLQKEPAPQDLVILRPHTARRASEAARVEFRDAEQFEESFSMVSPKSFETEAIVFRENRDAVKELLESLKFSNSTWKMVETADALYLVPGKMQVAMLEASDLPADLVEFQTAPLAPSNRPRGVVLLSMNQTDSYFQYAPEICTYLLEGANVFTYDNFGKGLSHGHNSQRGISESIESAYTYLKEVQGYKDAEILAKGQCAGGPPTSELGKRHPDIHVWIDQAPAGYQHMVGSLYKEYLGQGIKMLEDKPTRTNQALAALGRMAVNSSVLPQVVSAVLPSFDVPDNLRHNRGSQLFTIGVPDEQGAGGDKLVPSEQRERIAQAVQHPKGTYVPMQGSEHVTNWWLVPEAKASVGKFMQDNGIASKLLAPESLGRNPAERIYGQIFDAPYDPATATAEQKRIIQFLHMTFMSYDHVSEVRQGIEALVVLIGEEARAPLLKAALEIAKETKRVDWAVQLGKDLSACPPGSSKKLVAPALPG